MAELALARPLPSNSDISSKFMFEDLARSGLTPEDMGTYPVAPIAMGTCAGYCIPYSDDYRMYRIRYNREEDKYIAPKGMTGVWWSHKQNRTTFRSAPTLYIIEGEKKAAKFVKTWPHLPTLGIGGAWMFAKKNEAGVNMLLPELLDSLKPGMNVVAIFDGDIQNKPHIQKAAHTLNQLLTQQQCSLKIFRTPKGKGVDDWLVESPNGTLHDLLEIPLEALAIGRKTLYNALEIQLGESGKPIINEDNIEKLLRAYFENSIVNDKRRGLRQKGHYVREDDLIAEATRYIQQQHMANAPMNRIVHALGFFLQSVKCDIVRDQFLSLKWDEEERLNTWGQEYFTSDMPEYCAEWGRLLMTGLTFRVLYPGYKFDLIPMLIGSQGIGKTTFFEDLAVFDGEKYYNSCSEITPDVGDGRRTQVTAFSKAVIVDLGEGAAFNPKKTDQENFKQFITQTQDEIRVVYQKSTIIIPRSFIFVSTSNRHDQITDRSGSRRFLPIRVSAIKRLPYFEKLQILAEVMAKRDEIETTEWWNLNINWDKMPMLLKENKPHIHDIQTLVNSQFTRGDEFVDYVANILAAEQAATYLNTTATTLAGEMFISSTYLAARYPGRLPIPHAKARLMELALDATFPWELEDAKPRLSQLRVPEEYLAFYTNGIGAKDPDKQMLTGFKARKKT